MAIDRTTQMINEWKAELEAMTSSAPNPNFDPNKPEGPSNKRVLNGEFSCEKLQEIISEKVQQLTSAIQDKAASASQLMGTWAPIMKVPSDPLKIIKWALKVAFGPAADAIFAAIAMIRSIISLISAIAGLAAAIANAAAKLAACLEATIRNAIQEIIDAVLDGAADLLSQAEMMVDQLIADVLQDSGIQDALDTIDQIESEVTDGVSELLAAGNTLQSAKNGLNLNSGISIPPPNITFPRA